MFSPPEYKPYAPAFTTPMWSVPVKPSEEETKKVWNAAINAAMLALYEAEYNTEVVRPVKALLK